MQDFITNLEKSGLTLNISANGLTNLVLNADPQVPEKNILWTTDPTVELPIIKKKHGVGSENPETIMDAWRKTLILYGNSPALSHKVEGVWYTRTYQEYYEDAIKFGCALVKHGISSRCSTTILSYNRPEWFIAFFGAIFANTIACGLYITNQPEACRYVIDHCDSEICLVENQNQLNKILAVWKDLPKLKYVVVFEKEYAVGPEFKQYSNSVIQYEKFLDFDITDELMDQLALRMKAQSPGHCCSLVYTSGTTGKPKGVMLSHDNYTWINSILAAQLPFDEPSPRSVSFLPLSHVAAQYADILLPMGIGGHVYVADFTALKGALIDYLLDVQPNYVLAVPRLYEKMEEKAMLVLAQKPTIFRWAYNAGTEGTDAQMKGKPTGLKFKLFNALVFSSLKKKMGLNQAKYLLFGAAPMPIKTRKFFFGMNMYVNNIFGMSETSGPMTGLMPHKFPQYNLKSAGQEVEGTEIHILEGTGEVCFRGRNIFMGYLKNEEATKKAIDSQRRLHSGDKGEFDEHKNLLITGRLKELIITAGGENVAPVIVENISKQFLPFISNIVLIGDARKFISCLLTFKVSSPPDELPNRIISPEAIDFFKTKGIVGITTVEQAIADERVQKLVEEGIRKTNQKVVSRAAQIRKWIFIKDDFSIPGGEMTPTLKIKRSIVYKKYSQVIEEIYATPSL